jgi:hypothetical protein
MEQERLDRKRAGGEFEGYYEEDDGGGFAGVDMDFAESFGQGNGLESFGEFGEYGEYGRQGEVYQNDDKSDKPRFEDGFDACLHYIWQGFIWFCRRLWEAWGSIQGCVGSRRIATLRLVGLNIFMMVMAILGEVIFGVSRELRVNMLLCGILALSYTMAIIFRGGMSQIRVTKEDLLEIVGMAKGSEIDRDMGEDIGEDSWLDGDVEGEESEGGVKDDNVGLGDLGDEFEFDFAGLGLDGEDGEDGEGEEEFDVGAVDTPEVVKRERVLVDGDGRLSRARLYDIMMDILPSKTPDYAKMTEHMEGSAEFIGYENLVLKALASATKKAVEDVESSLVSIKENPLSIFIEMERVHGFTGTKRIQEEIEAFLMRGKDDSGISVEVKLSGNNYLVTILKEVRPVIFLRDVMMSPEVKEYLINPRWRLPTVIGVDEKGKPEMIDFASIESSITTGMARSGKSKSLTAKFGQQVCLNTPKDVQFIIIDPKNSELFKSMSLMPHVAGLHKLDTALDALRDIVQKEGNYRKNLFAKNKVNNIVGFNSKFPKNKLPYIWVIADEIMTIREEYSSQKTKDYNPWREFEGLLTIIFTQLPYVGIKLWGISHRVKSVLSPSLVVNLFYKESIRGSVAQVTELLGQESPKTKLRYPGDAAVWYAGSSGKFIKSLLVCFDEEDENKMLVPEEQQEGYFWREMSQVFYTIGFEYPERVNYGSAMNRLSDDEILADINDIGGMPVGLDEIIE